MLLIVIPVLFLLMGEGILYLLDVSLYTNGRPREFKEIEPDVKKNRDEIRSAPRIKVENINSAISKYSQ